MSAERSTWQRFLASDFFYDFRRSPVTIVSFVIVVTLILLAILLSWLFLFRTVHG